MRNLILAISLALMLSIVGCGSSSTPSNTKSDASTGGGPALSSAQLIERATSICRQMNAHLAAAKYVIHDKQELAQVAPLRAADEMATVAELRKLSAPADLAADWQRIIEYRTNIAEELNKIGQAAGSGDNTAMRAALTSSAGIQAQLTRVAKLHGLDACARVS